MDIQKKNIEQQDTLFLRAKPPRVSLAITGILAVVYTAALLFGFSISNVPLFRVLVACQAFFLWMVFGFIFTVWNTTKRVPQKKTSNYSVDVFITVAGEPIGVVEETVRAAKAMHYSNFKVYILNDGYVAKKDNWQEIEKLAQRNGVECITRKVPGGAKAGNINNALSQTSAQFVAVFDADHVPHTDFLEKTMHYFEDKYVGFVQTPQYYKNADASYVSAGAWKQQELFFGPICEGKDAHHSAPMCGTNMVIRRSALMQIGGIVSTNVAEDFVTGLLMHSKGWQSVYVPEVLAEGMAPIGFRSYYRQQLRWARGSIAVLFRYNPIFRRLSMEQRIEYLASASYFLFGIAVFINMLLPAIFFFTQRVPLTVTSSGLALLFFPYMLFIAYSLQASSGFAYTFRALAFSISSWPIHLRALLGYLFNTKARFAITSKRAVKEQSFLLVAPHILYIVVALAGSIYYVHNYGITGALVTNLVWTFINIAFFYPFIRAALD